MFALLTPRVASGGVGTGDAVWFDRLRQRTRGNPGDGIAPERINHYFAPRPFGEIATADMIDDVLTCGRDLEPDLVIFENYAFAGPLSAELLRVPGITNFVGPMPDPEVYVLANDAVSALWRSFGCDAPGWAGLYRDLTIQICPPSLEPREVPRGNVLALRPTRFPCRRRQSPAQPRPNIWEGVAMPATDDFPPGFFDRQDPAPDDRFYGPDRLVTHIDKGAIEAVGSLYDELGVDGEVLDLMSSWVSHFHAAPRRLVVLGMNERELAANDQAAARVVHDLNTDPVLPFDGESFDDATCCVSVDYLVQPVEVFAEVARVLRPGGRFVVTFSNRCFPTKVIRGWAMADMAGCVDIVRRYFTLGGGFTEPTSQLRTAPTGWGDPLWGVWATRT